ncbi:MAG: flotillin-like FloA family protein [Planctomycetales bacterium]
MENELLPVLIVLGVGGVFLTIGFIIYAKFCSLWLQAYLAGASISLPHLVAMRLRKVDPHEIVRSRVMAVQAGLGRDQPISTASLEAHYLAGGDVPKVIEALIAADRNGGQLTFQEAAALDLAGKDVVRIAQSKMMLGNVVNAETAIEPAGSVLLDGKPMDAVSVEGSSPAGRDVEIVEVRDNIVLVRPSEG